jgi:acyl-CoA synthetase (NDP forming)
MFGRRELDSMFYPRSVAVVGVSANPQGWGGHSFVTQLRKVGFPGGIYPVNPKATEIQGIKAYPSVKSIPEPVDLVIVSVPAPRVPEVLEDCIAAGVKNVHIFSSGFSETREEEGRQLEARITEIIQRGDLRVVGPNCMGLYVPASKLAAWGAPPAGSGHVAFLSQSGGHGEMLIRYAQGLGIYFSKVISFGNARGLQALDFLEYLAEDPDTRIITVYLEGLKDGNKVARLIKEINRTKPVIVWKGGLTESGARAVASHTASMAGEERIWEAFFAQTGAVRVGSLEEIADVVMLFLHLSPLRGRRTLLLGGGGGNSVAMADICSRDSLEVPPLSDNTRKQLAEFIPLAGNSIRNPLDVWLAQDTVELLRRCIEIAVADPVIDLVIVDRHAGEDDDDRPDREERQRQVNDFITDFAKKNPFNKPVVVAMNTLNHDPNNTAMTAKLRVQFALAGVPAYASQANATRALARFIRYHEFQAQNQD